MPQPSGHQRIQRVDLIDPIIQIHFRYVIIQQQYQHRIIIASLSSLLSNFAIFSNEQCILLVNAIMLVDNHLYFLLNVPMVVYNMSPYNHLIIQLHHRDRHATVRGIKVVTIISSSFVQHIHYFFHEPP